MKGCIQIAVLAIGMMNDLPVGEGLKAAFFVAKRMKFLVESYRKQTFFRYGCRCAFLFFFQVLLEVTRTLTIVVQNVFLLAEFGTDIVFV